MRPPKKEKRRQEKRFRFTKEGRGAYRALDLLSDFGRLDKGAIVIERQLLHFAFQPLSLFLKYYNIISIEKTPQIQTGMKKR